MHSRSDAEYGKGQSVGGDEAGDVAPLRAQRRTNPGFPPAGVHRARRLPVRPSAATKWERFMASWSVHHG